MGWRHTFWRCAASLCALLSTGLPALAEPPELGMPLDCEIGATCWIVNRVDVDPGPGAADSRCDDHTYDTHKGVDIAIAGGSAMRRGVKVLAAAPGIVRGTRDGMADVDVAIAGRASVEGRECGNGVLIEGEDGWRQQYCHMRKGSVTVAKGQRVEAGDSIGEVGMSGLAQFTHLHLQISRDGVFFDPDTGFAMGRNACGSPSSPMWSAPVADAFAQDGSSVYLAGFATNVPTPSAARNGDFEGLVIDAQAPALLVWLDLYRPDEGDRVVIRIIAPDGGQLIEQEIPLTKNQARRFLYAGRKRTASAWPNGTYNAEIALYRAAGGDPQRVAISTEVR